MGALGKKMMKTGTEPASSPKKGTAHAGWCLPPPPTRSWAQEHRGEETQRLADSKSHFLSAASLGTGENTSLSLFSLFSLLSLILPTSSPSPPSLALYRRCGLTGGCSAFILFSLLVLQNLQRGEYLL